MGLFFQGVPEQYRWLVFESSVLWVKQQGGRPVRSLPAAGAVTVPSLSFTALASFLRTRNLSKAAQFTIWEKLFRLWIKTPTFRHFCTPVLTRQHKNLSAVLLGNMLCPGHVGSARSRKEPCILSLPSLQSSGWFLPTCYQTTISPQGQPCLLLPDSSKKPPCKLSIKGVLMMMFVILIAEWSYSGSLQDATAKWFQQFLC